MGDFAAESSDYDILVVIEDNLTPTNLGGISDLHQRLLQDHPDAWRLEGDYAPRHLLVPEGTRRPVPGFGHGLFEAHPPEIMLSADNIANMRLHGIVVHGPPASDILPLVAPDQVRAAALGMLLATVDECSTEAEAASELLNRLRSRCAWETGLPTTKSQGVEWAVRHLDVQWHAVIRRAEAVRRGAATEEADGTLRVALPELIRLAQSIHDGRDFRLPAQ